MFFKKLLDNGFYPVGTVMSNRAGLRPEFKTTTLKKGERIAKRSSGMLATKWKDKRSVFMLFTINKDSMVDTTNPRSQPHEVMKPESVTTYNQSKAGVDKHDQMASYYPMGRKTMKWWEKIFFWLFVMGVTNAFKVYKISSPQQKTTLANFMMQVASSYPPTSYKNVHLFYQPLLSLDVRMWVTTFLFG